MGRTVVRQIERPRPRKARESLFVVGVALVLMLALVGLVSAGTFVAGKVSPSSSGPAKAHHPGTGSSVAVADLARAQAQATAIVRAANDAGTSIVRSATSKAHHQAQAIIAAAHRQASQITTQPATAPVAPAAPAQPSVQPPATSGAGTVGTTYGAVTPGTGGTTYGASAPGAGSTTAPNLRGLPPSWLVVGYNARFGSGPGSAGSISVVNRSGKVFSGVAVVQYAHGGSATAPFSGLGPGQSLVLPLNGAPYGGGGYRILVNVH